MPKLSLALKKKLSRKDLKRVDVKVASKGSGRKSAEQLKKERVVIKVEPLNFGVSKHKKPKKKKKATKAITSADTSQVTEDTQPHSASVSKKKSKQRGAKSLTQSSKRKLTMAESSKSYPKSKVGSALTTARKVLSEGKRRRQRGTVSVSLMGATYRTLLVHGFPKEADIYSLEAHFSKLCPSVRVVIPFEEVIGDTSVDADTALAVSTGSRRQARKQKRGAMAAQREDRSVALATGSSGALLQSISDAIEKRDWTKYQRFAYLVFPSRHVADLTNKRLNGKPLRIDIAEIETAVGSDSAKRSSKRKRKKVRKCKVALFKCSPIGSLRYDLKGKTKCVCVSNIDRAHSIGREHIRKVFAKHLGSDSVVKCILKEFRQYIVELPDAGYATMAVYLISGLVVSGRPLFVHWCDSDVLKHKKAYLRQSKKRQTQTGADLPMKKGPRTVAIGGEVDSDEEADDIGDSLMADTLKKLLA